VNIFVLNEDPRQAAVDQCNRHVVKMGLEAVQLLCTALQTLHPDVTVPYRPTHVHHPCVLWTMATPENAAWLAEHAQELFREYTRRYSRRHRSEAALDVVMGLLPQADWRAHQDFVQCMPDEWRHPDAVTAYRCFYVAEKSRFARWAPCSRPPKWWPFDEL